MTPSKSQEINGSVPTGPNDAPVHLAEEINQELKKCEDYSRLAVVHMLRLGGLLIQAKESIGHGKFHNWLEENCQLKMRQAQRYMKVAQHREIVEKANASRATHLSLRAALIHPSATSPAVNTNFHCRIPARLPDRRHRPSQRVVVTTCR